MKKKTKERKKEKEKKKRDYKKVVRLVAGQLNTLLIHLLMSQIV